VRGTLDTSRRIGDVDNTDLVKNGSVNAIRFVPGAGFTESTSRTLSTNPLWYYVNVRLLFNYVKSSLRRSLSWVVQEPNTQELWDKVAINSVRPFLMGLWRKGAFGPGKADDVFTIKCDAENNPPANIQQGIFTLEVYFYPSRPAETVVIVVGQQEGKSSASEA
jgi:phage tail sheath protein FI